MLFDKPNSHSYSWTTSQDHSKLVAKTGCGAICQRCRCILGRKSLGFSRRHSACRTIQSCWRERGKMGDPNRNGLLSQWVLHMTNVEKIMNVAVLHCIVKVLWFKMDRQEQTVQTQIRLLLQVQEQSDQDLHYHSVCIFWTHYSMVKPTLFKFYDMTIQITVLIPSFRTDRPGQTV